MLSRSIFDIKYGSTGSRIMKILLFAHDVVAVWATPIKLFAIPAVTAGVMIGFTLGRWIACLLVSSVAAVGLLYVLPHQNQLRHQLSLAETMAWSAILILPVLLILTSLGYFGARWIQQKRAKSQAAN